MARLVVVCSMLRNVPAHELPENLRRRLVLGAAGCQEGIAEFALHSDAKTDIFHRRKCSQWIHVWVARIFFRAANSPSSAPTAVLARLGGPENRDQWTTLMNLFTAIPSSGNIRW